MSKGLLSEVDGTDVTVGTGIGVEQVDVEATVTIPDAACAGVTTDVKGTEVAVAEATFDDYGAATEMVGMVTGVVELPSALPFCTSASISLFLFWWYVLHQLLIWLFFRASMPLSLIAVMHSVGSARIP